MTLLEKHLEPLLATPTGRSFGRELCTEMLSRGTAKHAGVDEMIFQEGDETRGMFLVSGGLVKLVRYTIDGREVILHLAQPYRFIAEAALFLGHYPATAVATEPSELILLRQEDVFDLMDRHPGFMRRIFDAMAIWMKRLVDKIDQLTLNDATARLAHYVLTSLEQEVDDGRPGGSKLTLPVKKGELALMLNMNQATLSRALRKLQDEQILAVNGRNFIVRDSLALQKASLPPLE
ncbi:Crp/Fnr family transcriptional regulator [bacterium]|nr:Crp/Fnr family transcriptional regulator [bacterium]